MDLVPHPLHEGDEFERLASRAPTPIEAQVLAKLRAGTSVWAEGLRPEAGVLLASTLVLAEDARCLIVSPFDDLLETRRVRLERRIPVVRWRSGEELPPGPLLVLASLTQMLETPTLDATTNSTFLPSLVVIEMAHASSPLAHEFHPALGRLLPPQLAPRRLYVSGYTARKARLDALTRHQENPAALALLSEPFERGRNPTGGGALTLRIERRTPRSNVSRPALSERSIEALTVHPRPALVLAATPQEVDGSFRTLERAQIPSHRFHSGMPRAERASELIQFTIPGKRAVLVAQTSFDRGASLLKPRVPRARGRTDVFEQEGFGHGYARADIQTLVRVSLPASLEQFADELGLMGSGSRLAERAEPSTEPEEPPTGPQELHAYVECDPSEIALVAALSNKYKPHPELPRQIYAELERTQELQSVRELAAKLNLSEGQIELGLSYLEAAAVTTHEVTEGPLTYGLVGTKQTSGRRLLALERDLEVHREAELQRLNAIEEFLDSSDCRLLSLAQLIDTMGEPDERERALSGPSLEEPCGMCDRCRPAVRPVRLAPAVEGRRPSRWETGAA